jgi:glucose dehydrogenase
MRTSLRAALAVGVVAALFVTLGCQKQTLDTSRPGSARALSGKLSEPDLVKAQADDGQWVMPAKNYASTRFSGLDEINAGNVR